MWFKPTRRAFLKSATALSLASSVSSVCMPAEAELEEQPAEIFVAPSGSDSNPGTKLKPFTTLARAQKAVRESRKRSHSKAVVVTLRGGWYLQGAPLTFAPEDGGKEGAAVVYRSMPGERAIVSGGRRLLGDWQPVAGKPYWQLDVAQAKDGKWPFQSLFVNGMSRQVARKAKPLQKPLTGTGLVPGEPSNGAFYFREGDLDAKWARREDAYLIMTNSWTSTLNKILSIDSSKRVVKFVSSNFRPVNSFYKEFPYYVCNFLEVLDEPGEWYLDRVEGKLYYYPLPGEDLNKLEVVAPVLATTLIEIVGSVTTPVSNLEFHEIAFRHTDWNMSRIDGVYRQGSMFLGAGVHARYMTHSRFKGCEFSQLGEYGLELAEGCQYNEVSQCHFWDMGGGAIQLGITDLSTQKQLEQHAPAMFVRASYNTVDNCLIHRLGTVLPGVYGIVNRFASFTKITHNEIFDIPWCAIGSDARWNPSQETDNYCHGIEVAYNHLHDLGLGFLRDTAGYYQFGPLDTHVHHNLIHDTIGKSDEYVGYCGVYLDEQSRESVVENNLAYRLDGLAFFQNWGIGNVFRNNIGAFARDGFFNRGGTKESPINTFNLTRSIYLSASKTIFSHIWQLVEKDGCVLDANMYWSLDGNQAKDDFAGKSFTDRQALGLDQHSMIADPMFRDPIHGDFSLLPDSPAPGKIGFVSFDEEIRKAGLYGNDSWRARGHLMPRRPRPVVDFGLADLDGH
jgi:hypothetical protein